MALFDFLKPKPVKIQSGKTEGDFDSRSFTITDALDTEINESGSYQSQVQALYKRFNNENVNGRELTRTCISYRTSWIAGNGVNVESTDPANQKFLAQFLKDTKLDGAFFRELVTYSELEGKVLLIPYWAKDKVKVRNHIGYLQSFEAIPNADDPRELDAVKVKLGEGREVTYKSGEFVYAQMSGIKGIWAVSPKVAYCLYSIDAVSQILRDVRANHKKFGKIFPVFECTTNEDARNVAKAINETSWKIGSSLALVGTAKYLEPSGQATASLKEEMLMHFRIISAVTGIPTYFLAPDLMSNRATASELAEMINSNTMDERENWKSALEELCRIASKKYRDKTGTLLDWENVTVTIPPVSLNQVQQLIDVYLPLSMDGIISRKSLREMVPNIDPEKEIARLKEENEPSDNRSNSATSELKNALSMLDKEEEEDDENEI